MSLGEEYPTSPTAPEPCIGGANTPLFGGYADTDLYGHFSQIVPIWKVRFTNASTTATNVAMTAC